MPWSTDRANLPTAVKPGQEVWAGGALGALNHCTHATITCPLVTPVGAVMVCEVTAVLWTKVCELLCVAAKR